MASDLIVSKPEVHPLAILQQAVEKGASIEQLTALMGLAERYEVNQDRKKFREAMAAFKQDPPKIDKNKHVEFKTDRGVTAYDHATLDNVCEQIVKRMADAGITHRWVPSQKDGLITVTCYLSLGVYTEETPLSSGADTSGGKNPIQAIASAVSYLERYTLLAATGIATGLPDDDGEGTITDDDQEVVQAISKAKTMEELKPMYESALKSATEAKNTTLVGLLVKAKKDRKTELTNAKTN